MGRGGLNPSYSFLLEIIQTILRMILDFSNGNNVFLKLYMRNIYVTRLLARYFAIKIEILNNLQKDIILF